MVERKEKQAEHVSTKWHALKGPFRYIFKEQYIPMIEQWYNTVAPHRHREAFREVAKAIHKFEFDPAASTEQAPSDNGLALHRAKHMILLYGMILNPAVEQRILHWLLVAPPGLVDKYRDVMSATQAMAVKSSTTKEAFVERPNQLALPKDRNRRKIDWESCNAAGNVRSNYNNPMATKTGVDLDLVKKANATGGSRKSERSTGDESAFSDLQAKKEAAALEGVYKVNEDGSTTYQAKRGHGAAKDFAGSNRIMNSYGAPASGWKSTTRDHIRNYGRVDREVVVADKHPAIARVTCAGSLRCIPPALFGDE